MSTITSTTTICNGRHHVELSRLQAYGYCSLLAVTYVASLYGLVPQKVRQLHRNDPNQIQFRTFATSIVCMAAMMSYRSLLCESQADLFDVTFAKTWWSDIAATFVATSIVLCHISVLYLGVFTRYFLLAYEYNKTRHGKILPSQLLNHLYQCHINPIWNSVVDDVDGERWIVLRNLVIAPISEEIVFRSCMVPVLGSTGMKLSNVCLVAPLFFGFAHVHHATLKLHDGNDFNAVVLMTTFQFVYTSIFGAYASYVYARTNSLVAAIFCHSLCNAIGLPDVTFLQRCSNIYPHRILLISSLAVGVLGFVAGLQVFGQLFPSPMISQS
jgi:prenyl protein peptidase